MKVWITKYALTSGIEEMEAEYNPQFPQTVSRTGGSTWDYFHSEGKNWHRTKEGAIARAEAMRFKKIASLNKSLRKLEKLKFE